MPTDIPIRKNDIDFNSAGLKTDSVIKVDKVATIDKKIIIGEIGFVSDRMIEMIENKLKIVFGFK